MTGAEPAWPSRPRRLGLYLHVPFCKNLCPFCPYNRHPYSDEAFERYETAVRQEIELYAPRLESCEVQSVYVGGGTPTVNLPGLLRVLGHLAGRTRKAAEICIELHPSSMDDACLEQLEKAAVTMVSIGVESTSDRQLHAIGRSHDGSSALDAVRRAVRAGFAAVNVDLMFALPGQGLVDWESDVRRVLDEGIDQLSTYPMFAFPYSDLGRERGIAQVERPRGSLIRTMLRRTDELARERGMERCAVWSWLRPRQKKFSSITRHHYVGFGPSAASMIGSDFYVNTFDVEAYARALPARRPVALVLPMDRRLELAYWLYWRLYELHAEDADLRDLFPGERSVSSAFGRVLLPFQAAGLIGRTATGYRVTNSGAYWVHRIQNEYSLNYINRLWGRCRREPWPMGLSL
jgi:oxygen-independent coproporphyrinogen-3 oxidase